MPTSVAVPVVQVAIALITIGVIAISKSARESLPCPRRCLEWILT